MPKRCSRFLLVPTLIALAACGVKKTPIPRTAAATEVRNCIEPDKTELRLDMPWRAYPDRTYHLHVIYHLAENEKDARRRKPHIRVVADDNGLVDYDPRSLDVVPNQETDVTELVLHDTPSGLSQVRMNTDDLPPGSDFKSLSIDLGFRGRVQLQDKTPLESWRATSVPLQIVDSAGKPLPLGAPIIVDITVSNALIHLRDRSAECPDNPLNVPIPTPEGEWVNYVTTGVAIGQSDIGTVEVKPRLFSSGRGVLHVRGFINDRTQVIFDAMEPFDIACPWWMRLGVAIVGGLSYSVYQLIRTVFREHFDVRLLIASVSAGVFAGVLAWTFSDLDILGIHADTSHLTGYFILGLVVSYVGIDSLLRRLGRPASR